MAESAAKKYLIIIQAGEKDVGRVYHGLTYGQQLHFAGYEVKIFFDGLGPQWIPKLEEPDHIFHPVFKAIQSLGIIQGACKYCAKFFDVQDDVEKAGLSLEGGAQDDHLSIVKYVNNGYALIII